MAFLRYASIPAGGRPGFRAPAPGVLRPHRVYVEAVVDRHSHRSVGASSPRAGPRADSATCPIRTLSSGQVEEASCQGRTALGVAWPGHLAAQLGLVDGLHRTVRVLDQGCPFAVTRWTNLYSPAGWGLFGDLIGGPVTELGDGIENVEVRIDPWWRRLSLLAHTAYWRANSDAASKLADAIGVDSTRWLGAHAAGLPWADTLRANASELRKHIAS